MKKQAAAILLTAAFAAGCAKTPENESGGKASVWSAADTVKIHRDVTYGEDERGEAAVNIAAVRNEYENAQVILTAEKDVKSYTVTLSDLTGAAGTFKKENFKIYNQKYIEVTKTTTNAFTSGWYPDALLPMEKAEEYGENTVKAGENQGVYFECHIPKDQPSGVYTGNFKILADGQEYSVPVSVKVYDYTLSDEVHSRSSFGIHSYWNEGGIVSAEKDASYEMYAAYYEYLLEHRISARYMPASMTDINGLITQLRKYAKNGKFTNYILPYESRYDADFAGTGIDYDLYERQFDAIAAASIEDNVNYLEKASTYFAMYDEIVSASDIKKANAFYAKILKLHFEIADKWETSLNCPEEMREALIDSMLNVTQLMVTTYSDLFEEQVTYCPLIDKYNTADSKANYQSTYEIREENGDRTITQNAEKWWYSCCAPRHPYASYHIDDDGYSPVVYSWMQYANDVVGNLYWSTTFYLEYVSEKNSKVYNALQDCYSTAMRFPPANGDGFLLYPGAPYGIYGPVGSIRLQQILDGLEEYDMLYALEEKYNALGGADFDGVLSLLYDGLFYGTKVSASSESYENAREKLLQMLELCENTGVAITAADVRNDYADISLYVPNGQKVTFDGAKIAETAAENGAAYTVRVQLKDTASEFSVSAGAFKASIPLGAKRTEFSGRTLAEMITANNGELKATENGAEILFAASNSKRHSAALKGELLSAVAGAKNFVRIELEIDGDCAAEVLFAGADGMSVPTWTGTLKEGTNTVEINISSLNKDSIGRIASVMIRFGGSGDGKERNVTVKSVVIQ